MIDETSDDELLEAITDELDDEETLAWIDAQGAAQGEQLEEVDIDS